MSANESTYSYTVTRVLDAPVAKVWRAWTRAEEYEAWFHAEPGSVSLDVRPGGPWAATMTAPDGNKYPMTGSFRDVEENRRLVTVMDLPGGAETVMDMRLTEVDGGTELVVTQECGTAEERDQSEEGTKILLDWCAEYLAKS